MDYLRGAQKFIQRARDAYDPEVMKQHLGMAEWCLSRAIEERDEAPSQEPSKKVTPATFKLAHYLQGLVNREPLHALRWQVVVGACVEHPRRRT